MVVFGEVALQTVLNDAFALFRNNLSYFVPDIYAQLPQQYQDEITAWWSNPQNNVPVIVGYALQPMQDPQIAITTDSSREVEPRQLTGNMIGASSTDYEYGTMFQATYAILVFGSNQNWLLWTQALVKWALMLSRLTLEQDYGFLHQLISLGPLTPVPDNIAKDTLFPYMRTVYLSCQHEETWLSLPMDTVTSTSINVNAQFS